ncbi:MAG: glycosyltransferase family 2 protein [Paludibacter sp.]|nr:glycosyltransferase family 2 protein [Paludibacter sp.]
MSKLHIICPVKDAIDTSLKAIDRIMNSAGDSSPELYVYNDFSSNENTEKLRAFSNEKGFSLINLEDVTNHPSPNYLLVLQMAQKNAIAAGAHLLIVESDVMIQPDTIEKMYQQVTLLDKPGMIAAVTTDETGEINFPYLYARKFSRRILSVNKRLSFCCTLLTNSLLNSYDFNLLNPEKNWYDVFISHQSKALGYNNYLMNDLTVLHLPHSSRPWKKLKYSNPLKYYWRKLIERNDKI